MGRRSAGQREPRRGRRTSVEDARRGRGWFHVKPAPPFAAEGAVSATASSVRVPQGDRGSTRDVRPHADPPPRGVTTCSGRRPSARKAPSEQGRCVTSSVARSSQTFESPSREVWLCAQARISRVRAVQRVALRLGRGKSASGEGGGGFAVSCRDVSRCGHRQGGRAGGPGRTRRLAAGPPTAGGAGERTGLAGPGGPGRTSRLAAGPRARAGRVSGRAWPVPEGRGAWSIRRVRDRSTHGDGSPAVRAASPRMPYETGPPRSIGAGLPTATRPGVGSSSRVSPETRPVGPDRARFHVERERGSRWRVARGTPADGAGR